MEVQTLKRLQSELDSKSTTSASSNFVKSDISFLTNFDRSSWVIDSGANKYMTGSLNKILTYTPCSGKEKVHIADGSLTSISGTGSVACTPDLSLNSVLYVPSFPVHLLSVSSLTQALNCKIEFFFYSLCFSRIKNREDDCQW